MRHVQDGAGVLDQALKVLRGKTGVGKTLRLLRELCVAFSAL